MLGKWRSVALASAMAMAAAGCAPSIRPGEPADPSGGAASAAPPGGLAPAEVPQFVHFGFDDNGISGRDGSGTTGGMRFVNDLFTGRANPAGSGNPRTYDGSPARFSLYVATRYIERPETDAPEHLKPEWRRAAEAGHEIGVHTHRHAHGAGFSTRQWSAEIADCLAWLAKPFDPARTAHHDVGIGVARGEVPDFAPLSSSWARPSSRRCAPRDWPTTAASRRASTTAPAPPT